MRLVDYNPEHIRSILDGNMASLARKSFGIADDIADDLVAPGLSFSGIVDGYVIASAGIKPLWKGVGEGWFVASIICPRKNLALSSL